MTRNYQISDWMLEKYLLDELDSSSRKKILSALESHQDSVTERLQKLQNSNREILNRLPVEQVSNQIRQKINLSTKKEPPIATPSFLSKYGLRLKDFIFFHNLNRLAYATLALALCFSSYLAIQHDTEETRLKGIEPHLTIYRKSGSSFEKLENQALVKKNDLLQLSYFSTRASYGVILSVDGRGSVTLHLPSTSNESIPLIDKKEVLLPNSFELDDAPQFDRFYFFTSSEPFLISSIIKAIHDTNLNNLNEILIKGISPKIRQHIITLKR